MADEEKGSGGKEPSRVVLTVAEESSLPSDLAAKWRTMEAYADHLEKRTSALEAEISCVRATAEKLRTQVSDSSHRERVYVRRLAHKDQELHECLAQLSELKASQAPGAAALRAAVLDPAVNLLLVRLRQEVAAHKTRLEETQSELSAWKFTPDSNTGKRLMAKCRLLYQENEELGRVVSSGRLAKLEGDLALQKRFSEEVKKSQSELDEFLQDLDEDVEGMQGTIYYLQQELRKTKEALTLAERTNAPVSNGQSEPTERTTVERTVSEDSDSDAPLVKKARRGSEVSLDYNDDDMGLTNGDAMKNDDG